MKAMVLRKISPVEEKPLEMTDLPIPEPGPGQILVRISACGVCHTELDEIEGRLQPHLPIIPGHEIVGRVEKTGDGATRFKVGKRVGIAWIYSSCGKCKFCLRGDENLCEEFQATGCDVDGGYAQYTVVPQDFAYSIPERFTDSQAAPLLCAGVIGYRALRLSEIKPNQTLALYGFGASAHITIQIAKYWNCKVFVFSRREQEGHRKLAKRLGADWTGATGDTPPRRFDCAIDFTPVGEPVREALRNVEKGGRVVVNAIRKIEPIPELDYAEHVWHEKELKSVANVTRKDAEDFLPLAAEISIVPEVQEFGLEKANEALILLKQGKIQGAGVLRMPE